MEWFLKLCESDPDTAALIEQAIDRLATIGPTMGRPLVNTQEHSQLRNCKELRLLPGPIRNPDAVRLRSRPGSGLPSRG
jgi:hypothetical protein